MSNYVVICDDDTGARVLAHRLRQFDNAETAWGYASEIPPSRNPVVYAQLLDKPCTLCKKGAYAVGDKNSWGRCISCGGI